MNLRILQTIPQTDIQLGMLPNCKTQKKNSAEEHTLPQATQINNPSPPGPRSSSPPTYRGVRSSPQRIRKALIVWHRRRAPT
jgi:hypothetical protein